MWHGHWLLVLHSSMLLWHGLRLLLLLWPSSILPQLLQHSLLQCPCLLLQCTLLLPQCSLLPLPLA